MPLAADVLLPLPIIPLRWLAPYGRAAGVVGARLVVPWRGGVRIGVVTALQHVSDPRTIELKEALDWLDEGAYLPARTIAWILAEAERAACPPGVVLAGLSLPGLKAELSHRVRELAHEGREPGEWREASELDPARLELLREQGQLEERVRRTVPSRTVLLASPQGRHGADADVASALAGAARANQRKAWEVLTGRGEVESGAQLARLADVPESAVRALVRKGFAHYRELPSPEPPAPPDAAAAPWPSGSHAIDAGDDDPVRVAGGDAAARLRALVPGLRRELASGRSPLLVAAERKAASDAAAWLANDLAVTEMTPAASDRERQAWNERVRNGSPAVVVGTYPVLAAPVFAPGRVVVLDAGSDAHKLRAGSRAFVPDAVLGWAAAHGVACGCTDVLLGPELRAWGGEGKGTEVTLPRPRVRWHPSNLAQSATWPLGADLIRVLRQVHERERQAVLLVPRRGFSAALGCRDCGTAVECPNCDLALRWHAREGRLRCHQCGHAAPPPQACPACGGPDLEAQRAAGSEWVLRALAQAVPDLPRFRWDGDVRDDLAPLYGGVSGALVGTTAVLRLSPLPVLSLVGVTQIDGGLHADDFRAEERTLRMLLSLAELAGDRVPLGVVQTFAPDHEALRALMGGDAAIARFEAAMSARRRRFGYPPAGRLARLQLSARTGAAAWRAGEALADRLRAAGAGDEEILGPAPAPVPRVRGRSLVQLLLRTDDEARRAQLLKGSVTEGLSGVRVRVDVDPRDIGEVLE